MRSVDMYGPTLYRAGRLTGMLQDASEGRVRWTLEYVIDGDPIILRDMVPRGMLCPTAPGSAIGTSGGYWDPLRDADLVPVLWLSGMFESFVSIDRIRTIIIGDA